MGNNASKPPGESAAAAAGANHVPSRSPTVSSKSPSSRHNAAHGTARNATHHSQHNHHHQRTLSPSSSPSSRHTSSAPAMGSDHSKPSAGHDHPEKHDEGRRSRPSKAKPVKVPRPGSDAKRQRGPSTQFEPSGPPPDSDFIPHSNFGLPPRLPLPISEELHNPGSPIIDADLDGSIPRQISNVSETTITDDELGDNLRPQDYNDDDRNRVPTPVYWDHGGEKVYITGTFTNWNRKYRMHKDPKTGTLSHVLQLPPGTHHVKFIVDGEMQLSNELPTAVDYTNVLVNYIEVSADKLPSEADRKVPEKVYHPPQVIPEGIDAADHEPTAVTTSQLRESDTRLPTVHWGRDVPPYIRDVDKPERTNAFRRASRAISEFPTPPGLPLFLGKSILNGTTPMKDDSSVLNMPNHTVLNHLATSSIKNDVLATSITTRYMRKYVTTVVYKPTEDGF